MNYVKIRVITESLPEFLPEILVAQLAEMGAESFEETENELFAYVRIDQFQKIEIEQFLRKMLLEFSFEEIEDQNWNKKWEESFKFIEIDDQVIIHANFHKLEKDYPFVINIQPKMAFGTGHHQTTRLVIRHMLEMDFENKKILDFGTGTGVLAILSEKMGGEEIVAIDIDQWSVDNSNENIEMNHCKNISVQQGNGNELQNVEYDIILANVNRNALIDRRNVLVSRLKPAGELILSGLLRKDFEDIKQVYGQAGLIFDSLKSEDEWIALHFHKQT